MSRKKKGFVDTWSGPSEYQRRKAKRAVGNFSVVFLIAAAGVLWLVFAVIERIRSFFRSTPALSSIPDGYVIPFVLAVGLLIAVAVQFGIQYLRTRPAGAPPIASKMDDEEDPT